MEQIKIGTLVSGPQCESVIPHIAGYGFETFSVTFWQELGNIDIKELGKRVSELLQPKGIEISSVSIFGNPLNDNEEAKKGIKAWETLIDNARAFDTDLVTGFTGRIPDEPIDRSIGRYKEVFGELAKRAEANGVRIAFENCGMGGTWDKGHWNIAHNPTAWEMMFDALPDENIGIEWEPCHQMVSLIDPIPQLRRWVPKIFHLHGKDATIAWDIVRTKGIHGPDPFVWHRTPGFGDSNWRDIITILRQNHYQGTIDIEGYHDPVYRGELEWTGQVSGLQYLKSCRGGDYIANPE